MSTGKSLSLSQNTFLQPPGSRSARTSEENLSTGRENKRRANIYDAVAGRINAHGFIKPAPYASKHRDTASSSTQTARPDELLFRRRNAPTRYQENDFYYAHDILPPELPLPSSDLLVGIHAYAADFYRYATMSRGQLDQQSMDETALIAMGVLVEEMAKDSLGDTGDLVLVEGEKILGGGKDPLVGSRGRQGRNPDHVIVLDDAGDDMDDVVWQRRSKRHTDLSDLPIGSGDNLGSARRKRSKRRKVAHPGPTVEVDTESGDQP